MSTVTGKKKTKVQAQRIRRSIHKPGVTIRIAKWGNCMAVRIPKEKALETGLQLGTEVSVDKVKNGVLIRPLRTRPTLADKLARMKGPCPYGEIDLGGPVGKEIL